MKLADVKKLLNENLAIGMFNINVPSLNKQFPCNQMTIGQRKTISKILVSSEYDHEYQLIKLSLLSELSPEIPLDKITDVDFISLLAQVRSQNITTPLTLRMNCPSCNFKFEYDINFDKIIENCNNYEFKKINYDITVNNLHFKFNISDPLLLSHIVYNKLQDIKSIYDKEDIDNDDIGMMTLHNNLYLYPMQFIYSIELNGELIEDFSPHNMYDKFEFFVDNLPGDILNKQNDTGHNVLSYIFKEFPVDRLSKLFESIECPECKKTMEGVFTYDSFFVD